MKYATFIQYANQDRAAEVRPKHREYLASLRERGKLAMSGPFVNEQGEVDNSGALIVYEAESLAEAEQLFQNDPFRQAGVFNTYQMKAWNQAS